MSSRSQEWSSPPGANGCNRSSEGWPSSAAFSADAPALTISEVAERTGLTRATARRVLLTLEDLGYVESAKRTFKLTPAVLDLAKPFAAVGDPWDVREALPRLADRADRRIGVDRHPRRHRDPVCRAGRDAPADDASRSRSGRACRPTPRPRAASCWPACPTRSSRPTSPGRPSRATPSARSSTRPSCGPSSTRSDDRAGRSSTSSWRRGCPRWRRRSSTGTDASARPCRVCAHAGRVDPATLRSEFLPLVVETARRVSAVGTRH